MAHLETDGLRVFALWANKGLTHRQTKKRPLRKSPQKRKRRIPTLDIDCISLKIERDSNGPDSDN